MHLQLNFDIVILVPNPQKSMFTFCLYLHVYCTLISTCALSLLLCSLLSTFYSRVRTSTLYFVLCCMSFPVYVFFRLFHVSFLCFKFWVVCFWLFVLPMLDIYIFAHAYTSTCTYHHTLISLKSPAAHLCEINSCHATVM